MEIGTNTRKLYECWNDSLKPDLFYCSECGIDLDIVKLSTDADYVYVPKFCPECGRKVRPREDTEG